MSQNTKIAESSLPTQVKGLTSLILDQVRGPIGKTLGTHTPTQSQQNFRSDLRTVLVELEQGLIVKNDAYGDSALNPIRCFARDLDTEAQIRVRLDDKLSRIMRGEIKVGTDTAAEDVIRDLLGYLVLYQIARLRKLHQSQDSEGPGIVTGRED